MRICVSHETLYRYDSPPTGVIQTLRLTPRNHAGQYVVDWRIDISADCRLEAQEDAFGNIVHAFSTTGPISELRLLVEGEVETQETAGVVQGAVERFPASLFVRQTPLTQADEAIAAYAAQFGKPSPDGTLSTLHALLARVHEDVALTPEPTTTDTTAARTLAHKRGTAQDLTHVFIAVARQLDVPARYVSGYVSQPDGAEARESEQYVGNAGHSWAEAHVPGLGWVGFDPTNGICITDQYIRVAIGLDYLGAAPVRGAHYGGGREALAVKLVVSQATFQAQG